MFTMKICDSDAFLDMPLSTQALYFHLNMRADDDGFVDNPKRISKIIGASSDDLNILIAKRFVLTFDNGVIVIKHWRMHNTLSKQRYHETQYLDEKSMLKLKENGAYSLSDGMHIDDTKLLEMYKRRTSGEQVENADLDLDLGLDIDLDLKEKEVSKDTSKKKVALRNIIPPKFEDVKAYCEQRNNGIDAQSFIDFYESKGWMIGKNKMKDWQSAIRTWENKRKSELSSQKKQTSNDAVDKWLKGGK